MLVLPECDKETVAIVPQPEPMFHSNAREADQLVWCHAAMWKPQTFVIYSPDTDIYNIGLTIPLQISIINNKMAAPSSDVPSAFHALNECGLPLSVYIHLQMCGLHLKNALWTSRQTTTGFSVNLFRPSWLLTNNKRNNNKRRRKPLKKKKPSSSKLFDDSLGTDGLPGVTVPDSEEACVTQPCKPSSHDFCHLHVRQT